MCKLIKFKKEIFNIDIRNRRSEDRRETTIEREYTTLRFNFSDFTRAKRGIGYTFLKKAILKIL